MFVAPTPVTVCTSCGYNLPFHDMGCAADGKRLVFACADHAPAVRAEPYDDGRATCGVCRQYGHHVKPYRIPAPRPAVTPT